jgi:hypothetical protein
MFQFVNNGLVIATADAPQWLEYLLVQYPRGQIVLVDQSQPVVDGAQPL